MAVAMPSPHTMATWNTPTCAPVRTAAHILPQPKKTSRNVPENSPTNQAGIMVYCSSQRRLAMGGLRLARLEELQVLRLGGDGRVRTQHGPGGIFQCAAQKL